MNIEIGIGKTRSLLILSASAFLAAQSLVGAEETPAKGKGPAGTTVSGTPDPAAAPGALRGVTLAPGGFSLGAVSVVIHSLSGSADRQLVTDAEGVFRLDDLQPGTYEITASKEGFTSPPATRVEVAAKRTANTSLQLAQAFGSLRGVTLAPGGFSLAEANVVVHSVADAADRSVVSDADGIFKLDDLPPGSYQIRASKGALSSTVATVEVAKDKTTNASLLLASASTQEKTPSAQPEAPTKRAVDTETPFAYADFSWLNGNSRSTEAPFDTPFFTPEARFDTHFMTSFNQPKDHTLGGATESFRSGEFQIEQISVGGDFHWQNVRGRILTMFGLYSATTPRNDASSGVGQWDVRSAYRYVSEAYGGYHFNVNHGLNVDAGIFVSYIGLFSYYNYDNWSYQPSFVSSNTPWFFNGLRIQWFPTNKLKIEPWIINGWQSYGKFNGRHGFGGQILYRPKEWLSLVFNNYGNGEDTLGIPRSRIHTDNSVQVRYLNRPENTGISKMAFSFTFDAGCEYGGGVTCRGGQGGPAQYFLGW